MFPERNEQKDRKIECKEHAEDMHHNPNIMMYKTFLFLFAFVAGCESFAPASLPASRMTGTSLNMVFGPKQALAIEKLKNPEQVESTIQGLMVKNKLTRAQAEIVSFESLLEFAMDFGHTF